MTNNDKIPSNMTHAILALSPVNGAILHFCGYFSKPKYIDYINLHKELKSDPEFALQDVDFVLALADDEDFKQLIEHFKTAQEEDSENIILRMDDGSETQSV